LDIPFICWFRVFRVLCCVFSEVFTLEEVDGVGDSGSGYATMVEVQTLLGAVLNVPQICLFQQ
jgi:hypothetical protein